MTTQYIIGNERDEKLNRRINTLLNQILGEKAAEVIYEYLENKYSIHRNEIVAKLDCFNGALEQYLGSGAFVIEKMISETLEENVDADFLERHRLLKLA